VIALVDYGAGNLTSVRKAFAHIGAELWTPADAAELTRATGIVVPGVGHFDSTKALTARWRAAINERVDAGVPLLGICVGLQWLFEGSEEAAGVEGLGVFKGTCFNLGRPGQSAAPLKVPHVGWNSLEIPKPSRLMRGVENGSQVYFTHSYSAPLTEDTAAICEYGSRFSAAVERGNVSAVQFHPEKSGDTGLTILRNWLHLSRRSAGGAEADAV
jgi:glutamine amidotransferase